MRDIFQKIKFLFKKLKIVFIISPVVFLLPLIADASWTERAFTAALVGLFKVPYYITVYPAVWMGDLLKFVISDEFIVFCYTCGDNPAVEAGLPIAQGLANIILVLVLLVVVGGIILGINEYGSKKMFVKLIIVALLINFAPLFVGLVVDGANIFMNYFVSAISERMEALKNTLLGGGGELILEEMEKHDDGGWTENLLIPIALLLMQSFINLVMIFVLFLYVLLYICRYVAIWIIVILSPIAFVCLIHPKTQSLWNHWVSQLIQWSFVGVTGAFFLYLSLQVNYAIVTVYKDADFEVGGESFIAETFSIILPLMMVAVFFIIGFMLSLKTSAVGADKVIGAGYATKRKAIGWGTAGAGAGYVAGKYAGKKGKEGAQWGGNKAFGDRAKDWSTTEDWGSDRAGLGGWALRKASKPVKGTQRAVGRFFGPSATEQQADKSREKMTKEQKKWSGRSADVKASYLQGEGSSKDMAAIVNASIEDGTFGDLMKTPAGEKIQNNYADIHKSLDKGGLSKGLKESLPIEHLKMQKSQGVEGQEIEKEMMKLAKDEGVLQNSAKHIEKKIEEGDEMAMKLGRRVLEQKSKNIQAFVDSAEKGMEAFNPILDKFYKKNEERLKQDFNMSKESEKRGASLHTINPSLMKHLEQSPGQIITDVKMPEIKGQTRNPVLGPDGRPV